MTSFKTSPSSWIPSVLVRGGILAAIAAYRLYRRYRKDMDQVHASLASLEDKTFSSTSSGLSVQYMHRPAAKERNWCLVFHPSGSGCDQGLALGELLLPEECGIIAPSRAGYLQTEWKNPQELSGESLLEAQAKAIIEILDHLGLQKVSILGLSAGSILSIELARKYPSRISSLVLVSPVIPYKQKEKNLPNPPRWVLELAFGNDFVKWMAVRLFPDATMQSMFGSKINDDNSMKLKAAAIIETLLPARERFPGFLHDFEAMLTHCLTAEEIMEIQCPILFLACKTDVQSKLDYNRLPGEMVTKKQATEMIRESGTHMLLNDIRGTQVAIQQFFAHA